jgi:aldose 1-epimerase
MIVTLTDAGSSARISVEHGFNCFELLAKVDERIVDVISTLPGFEETGERPSGSGIPILFPFPNRIREGKFSWDGTDYKLPLEVVGDDRNGNAIHGFVIDRPWRVVEQTESTVTGEFQLSVDAPDRRELWPADFVLTVRYELSGAKLRAGITIRNPDNVPLPWGLGTHPYFKLPFGEASRADQCLLVAPAASQWDLIECLPTGIQNSLPEELELSDGVYFGESKLDDVFSAIPGDVIECAMIDEPAGLQVTQRSPGLFRDLVIYTPPNRDAVCFEPYTCITDAINLEAQGVNTGWQVLPAGESISTWIKIEAGLVIA